MNSTGGSNEQSYTEIATLSDHPQEELEDEPNESEDEIDLNTYEADPQRQSVFREFNRILDAGLNREIPPLPEDLIEEMDEMPDIVVILNESVFDPSKLDYDFADALKFAFFQKGKYTKYNGILNVNTFGGST